jgi:plastocyanin
MKLTHLGFPIALAAALLAACAGHGAGSGATIPSTPGQAPMMDGELAIAAVLPAKTVGEELPYEGVGSVKSAQWKTVVGGFTQKQYAQTLAFPPGTKITIRNLSKKIPHTFNVVQKISGPPAKFPSAPKMQLSANGGGKLGSSYRSGVIQPGKSITVTLTTAGTYLIGCAYHYGEGMRDVIVVKSGAKPGPQGTPPTKGSTPTPDPGSSSSSYGY